MWIQVKVKKYPNFRRINTKVKFGIKQGLDDLAEGSQQSIMKSITHSFTIRSPWWKHTNKMGIKRKKATTRNLQSIVQTRADWLQHHERGAIRSATKGRSNRAIPKKVNRLGSGKIGKAQRPKNLKRSFKVKTKRGFAIIQRLYKGKRSKTVLKYLLRPRVRIRKKSTFFEPGIKHVRRNVKRTMQRALMAEFSSFGKK